MQVTSSMMSLPTDSSAETFFYFIGLFVSDVFDSFQENLVVFKSMNFCINVPLSAKAFFMFFKKKKKALTC